MLGSQALETAIGLAAMFFILATAASTVTESISRMFRKRAKDFEETIREMLTARASDDETGDERKERLGKKEKKRPWRKDRPEQDDDFLDLLDPIKKTSVWQAAEAAAGRTLLLRRKVGNSYLSAKSFADAVHEVVTSEEAQKFLDRVPSLKKRLGVLVKESKQDMLGVKAGLEAWFDETMSRAEGAYKRWASLVLFLVGLSFAVVGNASTTDVASDLWKNSATRAVVAEAASNVGKDPGDISKVAAQTDKLTELHLPVGWDVEGVDDVDKTGKATETNGNNGLIDFVTHVDDDPLRATYTSLGWLLTALLVMMGGPFWFDLLTRLVALRSTGTKPLHAADDDTSATKVTAVAAARKDSQTAPKPDDHQLVELRRMLTRPEDQDQA